MSKKLFFFYADFRMVRFSRGQESITEVIGSYFITIGLILHLEKNLLKSECFVLIGALGLKSSLLLTPRKNSLMSLKHDLSVILLHFRSGRYLSML